MDAIRVKRESLENQINVCNSRADLINFSRTNPEIVQFCYYYNIRFILLLGGFSQITLEILDRSACSETKVDDHSVLSSIIISINTSFENKRILLKNCLSIGYQLTTRDIQLSKLIFYENIPVEYKFIFWFNLDILPEIRRYIIFYIIDILNVEHGLF